MNWIRYFKAFVANSCVIFLSLLLAVVLFEGILRSGWLDIFLVSETGWISPQLRHEDRLILQTNREVSKVHPYYFTDRIKSQHKRPGVFRIAILGDSFIWGDGLHYSKTWNHKLEQLLRRRYKNVEVLHWGKNGWNTSDQLSFYRLAGEEYAPDLVIFGFVSNDTDMNNTRRDYAREMAEANQYSKLDSKIFFFHYTTNFVLTALNKIIPHDDSYNWYSELYSEKNLSDYGNLLQEIKNEMAPQTDFFFFFTPAPGELTKCNLENFSYVEKLLEERYIPVLNALPELCNEYAGYESRTLWANPANGHPGEKLTSSYAEKALRYIERNYADQIRQQSRVANIRTEQNLQNDHMPRNFLFRLQKSVYEGQPLRVEHSDHQVYVNTSALSEEGKAFKNAYLELNGERIYMARGPFYKPLKRIPDAVSFSKIKNSELMFSGHIPKKKFKRGINDLYLHFIEEEGRSSQTVVQIIY